VVRNSLTPELGINTLLEDISAPRCKRPGSPLHMLVRSRRTCSPVVATPRGAGTPPRTRESSAMNGMPRIRTLQRRSDRSDPSISDWIPTSVSMCASQASMPLHYGLHSDHQYHVYTTVSHPLPPYQNLPETVVAGSSAVYPTVQRCDPIPVGFFFSGSDAVR